MALTELVTGSPLDAECKTLGSARRFCFVSCEERGRPITRLRLETSSVISAAAIQRSTKSDRAYSFWFAGALRCSGSCRTLILVRPTTDGFLGVSYLLSACRNDVSRADGARERCGQQRRAFYRNAQTGCERYGRHFQRAHIARIQANSLHELP